MKYILPVLAVLLSLSCRPKATCGDREFYNAKEYTAFVSEQHQKILSQMTLLNEQFDNGNEREIKSQYSKLISVCDSALYMVNMLSDFNNEKEFKESAVKLFSFYGDIFHNQYRNLLEMYLSKEAPIQSKLDSMQAIVKNVNAREDSLKKSFEREIAHLNSEN